MPKSPHSLLLADSNGMIVITLQPTRSKSQENIEPTATRYFESSWALLKCSRQLLHSPRNHLRSIVQWAEVDTFGWHPMQSFPGIWASTSTYSHESVDRWAYTMTYQYDESYGRHWKCGIPPNLHHVSWGKGWWSSRFPRKFQIRMEWVWISMVVPSKNKDKLCCS